MWCIDFGIKIWEDNESAVLELFLRFDVCRRKIKLYFSDIFSHETSQVFQPIISKFYQTLENVLFGQNMCFSWEVVKRSSLTSFKVVNSIKKFHFFNFKHFVLLSFLFETREDEARNKIWQTLKAPYVKLCCLSETFQGEF